MLPAHDVAACSYQEHGTRALSLSLREGWLLACLRGRPGYPAALVDWLEATVGAQPGEHLADVGCGTGLLAGVFLSRGYRVTGVEPDEDMRTAAGRCLNDRPLFGILEGTAEATGLPAGSVDGVIVGTAFHWFDVDAAAAEFRRILRPGGWVLLAANERAAESDADQSFYDLLTLFRVDADKRLRRLAHSEPERFLGPRTCSVELPNPLLDEASFAALAFSRSYMPRLGEPRRAEAQRLITEAFTRHARDGIYPLGYRTTCYVAERFGTP